MRLMVALCALLVGSACSERDPVAVGPIEPTCQTPAPLYIPETDAIPNEYIVVFADDVTHADLVAAGLAAKYRFTPRDVWSGSGFSGFSATLKPSVVAALRCEAAVKYIEQNAIIHVF